MRSSTSSIGSANQLIKSFLSRKQFVSIKGAKSKLLQNNYGVPQVLIFDPLLFLLYVNDMPQAVNSMPILFADDTCFIHNCSKGTKIRNLAYTRFLILVPLLQL